MKYKTSELEGALLDAAVAQAMGVEARIEQLPIFDAPVCIAEIESDGADEGIFSPSIDWQHGGPIIEEGRIITDFMGDAHGWQATANPDALEQSTLKWLDGESPLIAAMRAYVASKFGEEVELP